jgi:adenosine deaminase
MNIKKMPKILLHIHLDGSVRIKTAKELLHKKVKTNMVIDKNIDSLATYLTKFEIPISIMQTEENLIRVSKELAEDLKKDNIIYAEIRFCPIFHTKQGLSLDEVVESVIEGLKEVDIKTNLLLCMMRELSYEDNAKIIYLAKKYLNKGVVGIDLAGDEGTFPTKNYQKLFELANPLNIPYTIHAGEVDNRESIISAIEFGTKRIGHGISCINDEEIIKKIIDKNITLEICPTSNVDTRVVKQYETHPIKRIFEKGALITINTDNNTVSNITLAKEYKKLIKHFQFTEECFKIMNINAVNASFISKLEKEELILKINNY